MKNIWFIKDLIMSINYYFTNTANEYQPSSPSRATSSRRPVIKSMIREYK